MKHFLLALNILLTGYTYPQQSSNPIPSHGKVIRLENFQSQYISSRNIDIWLPDNYSSGSKYAVLYMHDGQMLFDSTKSWNGQEWKVDEVLSKLMLEGKVNNCIVVGIWNDNVKRFADYFPQKAINFLNSESVKDSLRAQFNKEPLADNYLLFLVNEVKPYIDNNFNTYTDSKNTSIMGSSMGGLISLYAICEYPLIFGNAACLSTHWVGTLKNTNPNIPLAINSYLLENLPNPLTHRIYLDYGNKTLDSLYKPYQLIVDKTMEIKGYNQNNWITLEFIGADHSERSWSKRIYFPLTFLLGKVED